MHREPRQGALASAGSVLERIQTTKRLVDTVFLWTGYTSGLLFTLLAFFITYDVLARKWGYFLGIPTTRVTDEISGYIMALAVTWGFAYTLQNGGPCPHRRAAALYARASTACGGFPRHVDDGLPGLSVCLEGLATRHRLVADWHAVLYLFADAHVGSPGHSVHRLQFSGDCCGVYARLRDCGGGRCGGSGPHWLGKPQPLSPHRPMGRGMDYQCAWNDRGTLRYKETLHMLLLVAAILMTVFFAIGLHVATALGLIGVTMMHFFSDRPLLDMLGQIAWNANSNFILVAVPLFMMMGEVLLYGGISERLYTVLSYWLAPFRGGLLHSNIAFSAMFGAVSGSSAASAATVGAVSMPSFLARGYSERWWSGRWRLAVPWIFSFRRAFPWLFTACWPRSPSAGCTWRVLPLVSCCQAFLC